FLVVIFIVYCDRLSFLHDALPIFDGLARFRVNIFRDNNGVGAVLRLIPSRVLSADELRLKPAIRRLCQLSKGLVLVTGPTGSGRSEEHTSEFQSREKFVCRLLLEK